MVKKPKGSLGGSGTLDWLAQRVSAVMIAIYLFAGIAALAMCKADILSYELWASWFAPLWMKLATIVTLAALCLHAWVGMWSVATDYVKTWQTLFLTVVAAGLIGCLYWGVVILWGL